jgi:hypothetical protein
MADDKLISYTGNSPIRHFIGLIRGLSRGAAALAAQHCPDTFEADQMYVPVRALIAEKLPDMSVSEAWLLRQAIWQWREVYQDGDNNPLSIVTYELEMFVASARPKRARDIVARARYFSVVVGEDENPPNAVEAQGMDSQAGYTAALVYGTGLGRGQTFRDWHEERAREEAHDAMIAGQAA